MNYLRILIFTAAVASLTGCASVYRSGDTPDDIYYAPQPESYGAGAVYQEGRSGSGAERYGGYNHSRNQNYYDYAEDRYLRLMVGNRMRWSYFDDYYYGWGPGFAPGFGYGYGLGYGGYGLGYGYPGLSWGMYYNPWSYSSFNNYWMWNNYYNPYYPHTVIISPKTNPVIYNNVRNLRPESYTNTQYRTGSVVTPGNTNSVNKYNNTNYRTNNNMNTRSSGRDYNSSPSQPRYNQGSNSRPERTYTPPSNNNRPVTPSAPSSPAPSRSGGVTRPSRDN